VALDGAKLSSAFIENLMLSSEIVMVGVAGWNLPSTVRGEFSCEGSHLQRYASKLNAAEINSTFYQTHTFDTFKKWALSVPKDFQFSVKLSKGISHDRSLDLEIDGGLNLLDSFLRQSQGLGKKFSCLLVQLPPGLEFNKIVARNFFHVLRELYGGRVAIEPRHFSWFTTEVEILLREYSVTRILADPVLFRSGCEPGGDLGMVYLRLHGSPRRYSSSYSAKLLSSLSDRLNIAGNSCDQVWCIFANTASGAAVRNALKLSQMMTNRNKNHT
jgi:uncharacterized protein YecE (DUF72 family)